MGNYQNIHIYTRTKQTIPYIQVCHLKEEKSRLNMSARRENLRDYNAILQKVMYKKGLPG